MTKPTARIKRAIDVIGSLALLVVTSPLMLVLAVAIRLRLGRPVVFRQLRPGLHEQPFEILKFRTMSDARDASGKLLPDEDRITPFGMLLRRLSLDELPELWNVLRGDMSLVGPRPLLMEYLDRYDDEQRRRHDVLPGITGLAAVNGRNTTPWSERLAMDVWYAQHASLRLDVTILARTVGVVLSRRGVSQQGRATMARFHGNGQTDATGDGRREQDGTT